MLHYYPATAQDGYKLGHPAQYPELTQRIQNNWTARGSRIPGTTHVVKFGLQYYLQRFMMDDMRAGFFDLPIDVAIKRFARRVNGYLGPHNNVGTAHIGDFHDLQYVPLQFAALPEGTRVPLRVPMFTTEATHDNFGWMPNAYESLQSSTVWMMCTSATTGHRFRTMLNRFAEDTGTDPTFTDWQGHDFSFRGLPGIEAAMMSGSAHLLSSLGTDIIPALDFIEQYYFDRLPEDYFIGGSIPATEHAVMCAGGKESELETNMRLLDIYPEGPMSVVEDTWNLWKVIMEILPKLKDRIMARNGKFIIRPDSGSPVLILCGDPDAEWGTPASKGVIQLLWELFGGTQTNEGYNLLDSHIGCIYGDAITYERGQEILTRLKKAGFASGNIVFGNGSYTYQGATRDTHMFAVKATWALIDGVESDLYKKPVTDDGTKFSAKGRLAVVPCQVDGLKVIQQASAEDEARSLLKVTWRDGQFTGPRQNFEEIRQTLWAT